MATFCDKEYSYNEVCSITSAAAENYDNVFQDYPFELSNFQKWAIHGILEKKHVLVTAHTGSGKTLPAEFAIQHYINAGKKVIYTSPIKALSNQKFYEFQNQFPHISFGLLTGDIKSNPEADVLIMTTEILRNTLFQKKSVMEDLNRGKDLEAEDSIKHQNILSFEMDIENELGCVVFDEIHYINDADRGKVWEETIMMLPNHIQMLMLSATLDKPENFANWIYLNKKKPVWIASTNERVVPLKHYYYTTLHGSTIKKMADKGKAAEYEKIIDKPLLIKTIKEGRNTISFSDENYYKSRAICEYIKDNNIRIKRQHVINSCIHYLKTNNMLPAICFVFSRKVVEEAAREITVNLFNTGIDADATDESKIPSIIEDTCKKILLKLPNYKEYTNMPEYHNLLYLFKRGIAIHHSGMMPIFREMVELVFAKGYIKVLFATETFAVGINMPTKTVMFSSLNKYDGSYMRQLYSHEYTQMAGRAGRRGLDKIGHVIHLNNLFEIPNITDYKMILNGKPQSLVSKFKIHYNLVLNLIINNQKLDPSERSEGSQDKLLTNFIDRSMIKNEINKEYDYTKNQIATFNETLEKCNERLKTIRTPIETVKEYVDKKDELVRLKNKQWKRLNKEIKEMELNNKALLDDFEFYKRKIECEAGVHRLEKTLVNIGNYTLETVSMLLNILMENGFLDVDTEAGKSDVYTLNEKGNNACHIQEWHCLAVSDILYETDYFKDYTAEQLAVLFSCFANIRVLDDDKRNYNNMSDETVKKLIHVTQESYNKYFDIEMKLGLDTGYDFNMHYNICDEIGDWCFANNENECKIVLEGLAKRDIFVGEFVKSILKINNIAVEMEKVCEVNNRMDLLKKLREIPDLTLKFVATNQSLYV